MQLQAITHIPLSKDAYMVNENTIVIRLKVGKGDIKSSDVYYGDRVCMSEPILVKRVSMKKIASDELFDYFEGKIKSEDVIDILKKEDRRSAGKTANGEGLYLKNVFY